MTSIHGITRRPIEEGTLAAGTLARGVVTTRLSEGNPSTRFEASTDNGQSWYEQETYEDPEGLFALADPIRIVHVYDADSGEIVSVAQHDDKARQ